MRYTIAVLMCLFAGRLLSQDVGHKPYFKTVLTNATSSFRGLSVVNNKVAWLSGSRGTICKSTDGGNNWEVLRPKGYEKIDFRDVEAFDSNRALVISAGSPAYILRTDNGGESWLVCYENKDSNIFLDGFDFWNEKEGIAFGDPIDGKFRVLLTNDGGLTWTQPPVLPEAKPGEAAFAASGTSIKTWGDAEAAFVTGGLVSRLFLSHNQGLTWESFALPVQQGEGSKGAYTLAVKGKQLLIAGGNYAKPDSGQNVWVFDLKSKVCTAAPGAPKGYLSCIEQTGSNAFLATGTTGTFFSAKGGKGWVKKDAVSYNTVRKAKKGKLVIAAGDKGRIGVLF